MFEAVTIAGSDLNAGTIAEALIYYGRVDVVVGGGPLVNLARSFGGENIIRAVDLSGLRLMYERTRHMVVTTAKPFEVHGFGGVSMAGAASGEKVASSHDELETMFVREFGNNRAVRSLVRNLSDRLHERDFRTEITQQTVADVLDEAFMTQAVAAWLKIMVPEYVLSKNFKVQTADTGSGYIFATGLDFEEINKFYHRRIPASHSTVTPAWLLTQVQEMRKEISYSADASSDIWLGPGEAAMLKTRIDVLASRASKSQSNISTFHDVEFEGRTFKETINSGHSSIAELLNLLENDETRKFKLWLNAQPSAGVLVKEYDRSIFRRPDGPTAFLSS